MINAQELRIGNWVKHLPNWSYRNDESKEFYFQWDDSDWYKIGESCISLSDIEPIALTEEILLKCGFECVHSNNKHYTITDPNGVKDLHKISIFPTINNCWQIAFSDILNGYKDYIPTTKIQYLHELQNLFFALTKTELEVTL
jgi:hypothetical protein